MWKDPATGETRNGVASTNYTHDYLIDKIIAHPGITQRELARELGYTEGWLSMIMSSDSYQAAYEKRVEEMRDPVVRQALDTQFKALAFQSAEILRRKLEANPTDALALKTLEVSSKALGYGARIQVDARVQHNTSLIAVLSSLNTPGPRVEKDVTPAALSSSA